MRNIEQRSELDDFELSDNYDFSDGIRGRFYQSEKVAMTLQVDNDVLLFLKKQASEKHVDYTGAAQRLIARLYEWEITHKSISAA